MGLNAHASIYTTAAAAATAAVAAAGAPQTFSSPEHPFPADKSHFEPNNNCSNVPTTPSSACLKGIDAGLLAARIADGPGAARQSLLNSSGRKEASPLRPRHRVYLSADDEHKEALVLVSIVTEGERREGEEDSFRSPDGAPPETKQTRATGWAAGAPAAGNATGEKTRGNERGRGLHAGYVGPLAGEGGKGGDQHERKGGEAGEQLRRRCLEKVEAAAVLGFEELRRRHVNDVEALFNRVDFSLGPSSEGDGEPEQGVTASPSSCVAGLPIRTRVSRSGMACTERGGEESDAGDSSDGREELATSEDTERIVVDDGLIELMYHFGRWVRLAVWVWHGKQRAGNSFNHDICSWCPFLFCFAWALCAKTSFRFLSVPWLSRPNINACFHAPDEDAVGGYLL